MACNCMPPSSTEANPYNIDGKGKPATDTYHVKVTASVFRFPAGSEQWVTGSMVPRLLELGIFELV